MAAMSAVLGTTTLTPPSSSHADQSGWKNGSANHHDNSMPHKIPASQHETNGSVKGISSFQNGNSDYDPYASNNYFNSKDQRTSNSNSTSDPKRLNADITPSEHESDDERSKWIHRDKLARIENQELQAAGIVLPKPRARSRPGRDRSQDKNTSRRRGTDASEQPPPRSRKNSELSLNKTPEVEVPAWDLRLPDEIAEDPGEYFVPTGTSKSRIPVAKSSPAPIPVDFLDRDEPVRRQPSYAMLDEDVSIALRKPRTRSGSSNALEAPKLQPAKRSVTEGSPKKGTATGATGARKTSAPAKSATQGRPKTRSGPGPAPRSNSTTRPTTRSGELSPSKAAPEGDPPWMISAYKPDPRLPPDQQLLPTVARRLQQEKWEQEGKFGNIYDREFRPLNDEGFLQPPELQKPKEVEEGQNEWPLRADAKSPNTGSRPGTSSYSTMPRIQDTPAMSPLASPRTPQQPQIQPIPSPRVPTEVEQPQEKPKKSGCGCCVVM
ncbi:hypothetical protein GGR53DRAFT_518165 [Hypoxylon sp. FL1150]|nr:hypothetical protein GGR53DRAFT_518165 [Hypoxylon sp. FL1150]